MKSIFISAAAMLAATTSIGQTGIDYYAAPAISFDSALSLHRHEISILSADDSSEGSPANALNRWSEFWSGHMANNAPSTVSKNAPANIALQSHLKTAASNVCNTGSYKGNWKCIGPFRNYYGTEQ